MKNAKHLIFLSIIILACKQQNNEIQSKNLDDTTTELINEVVIEDILIDSILNIRAIELFKDSEQVFYLNADGRGGLIDTYKTPNEKDTTVVYSYFENHTDSIKLNYRAAAITENSQFGMSIGNPAYLIKDAHDGVKVVYYESHDNVFYDSMEFWNNLEGLAIGDPTEDCMSIIITRDGGETWNKLDCNTIPKSLEGEAAFAASDTNIAIVGEKTWVATGGVHSRILYSPDKGKSWEVYNTPIIQGKPTTGIYSIDFYDELNGFGIGGDYTDPDSNSSNKIRTDDGGKTWIVVSDSIDPGYRSCVQYVPLSDAKELIAIGFKGVDYSNDAGDHWQHLSDEGFYTIRFLNDSIAYAAGNGRISKLTFKRE